ncbi:MAG: serine/threonine protein kinase [Gemmataceae bacterium]|nr:serine/threonine protein kinase [Gemmataceae bacterium]
MLAACPQLLQLSLSGREKVEAWLFEFQRCWTDARMKQWLAHLPPADSPLRLPALIELVRIDLENHWRRGRKPRVEAYLRSHKELAETVEALPYLIAAECEVRKQVGDKVDLDEVARRFPNHAEAVCQLLDQSGSPIEGGPTVNLTVGEETSAGTLPTPASAPPPPRPNPYARFGRYLLLRALGEGGMGEVHLAEDTELKRRVALKIPRLDSNNPEVRTRFLREAQAMATLDHRNICPVYDVGEVEGRLFLTMKYIEGRSLSEILRSTSLLPLESAELIRKLAVALHTAHERKIVHRDLKPSNILVDGQGEPVVLDFGLVRAEENPLTKPGTALGTPAYMAPEQAEGKVKEIGPAVDIYALGVLLYQCLTGRLPFEGPPVVVIHQILTQQPEAPSRVVPGLDVGLETICLKAMAKNAGDRYSSMRELAQTLGGYLASAPPTLPALTSPIAPVLVPAAPVAPVSATVPMPAPTAFRPGNPPPPTPVLVTPTVPASTRAPKLLVRALVGSCVLIVALTAALMLALFGGGSREPSGGANRDDPGKRQQDPGVVVGPGPILKDPPLVDNRPPLKAGDALQALLAFEEKHEGPITNLSLSADGARAASAGEDRSLRLWDVKTGKELASTVVSRACSSVTLAPGGDYLLACDGPNTTGTGRIYRWNLKDEAEDWWPAKGKLIVGDPCSVLIARDDRSILIGDWRGLAFLVDPGGQPLRVFYVVPDTKDAPLAALAWTPDGKRFLAADVVGGNVQLWGTGEQQRLCQLPTQPAPRFTGKFALALSRDGRRALTSSKDTAIKVWELNAGKDPAREARQLKGHTAVVTCLAFAPDRRLAVSGSKDRTLRLWDIEHGIELRILEGHQGEVTSVAFTPNGRYVLSGSKDRTLRLWEVPGKYLEEAPVPGG